MPLYEYKCQDCGHVTEILQRGSEKEPDLQCSECGSRQLRRKFSVFGTVIGGSNIGGSNEIAASCPTGTCPLPPRK